MWQHARERATCGSCGTRPDEWVGPDGPRLDAYEAHERLCHGCRALSHKRDQQGENPPAGLQIVLRRPKPKEVARGEQA